MIEIPAGLAAAAERGPDWADWIAALPRRTEELLAEWNLKPTGQVWHGYCSLVVDTRHVETRQRAVLKVSFDGDDESRDEHLALARCDGHGAVQLLRADPARRALLLERLSPRDLSDEWDVEACQTVGRLYRDLHVPPMPQLASVGDHVRRWTSNLESNKALVPIPRRLVDQTISTARDLIKEPETAVVHGDLHYANVLLGAREGASTWLAIDPKPMNGWPEYEPEPMLRNRYDEYGTAVRWGARNRLSALVEAGGLDWDRARAWVMARAVINAHWAFEDAVAGRRNLTDAEKEHVTRCITLAKAVQD